MKNDPGFWTRFWARVAGGSSYLKRGDTHRASDPVISGSEDTVITPETALKRAAVWACVRLRAQTISTLPFQLRDANKKRITDHDVYRLLRFKPNADMTSSEFWEAMVANYDLRGNAYARIFRTNRGKAVSVYPQNSALASVRRRDNGDIQYSFDGNLDIWYPAEDVLHLKGFTLDGLVGLSTLEYSALTIGLLHEADLATRRELTNGLKSGGFLKTGARRLTDEQRELLHESLKTFSRPENAGRWMLLEADVEPTTLASMKLSPLDAQLLESRYFSIEEICRVFGVPPQLIGHVDKASSWASSLENTNLGFLTYSLTPTLVRMEQAISVKLLSPADRERLTPKFSVQGLLRADSASRASYYKTMGDSGFYTINHVRELEDLPPVEGGDEVRVQQTLVPLEEARLTQPINSNNSADEGDK